MLPLSKATRDLVDHHGRRRLHKWGWSCSNSLGQTPFRIAIVVLPRHDHYARSDFLEFERRWLALARSFDSEGLGGTPVTVGW
jgi:hypothetical protein